MWLGAAVLAGVVVGLSVVAGDYISLVWAALLLFGVGVLSRALDRDDPRRAVLAIALCAGALRMALGLAIHMFSASPGGFVTGDDAAYYRLSSAVAAYLAGATPAATYGPPYWGGEAFLFGVYVYIETGIFMIFGPDVRLPILLNGALSVVTALLIFDLARRLFGRTSAMVALVIVASLPSLILWSALNLKDAMTATLAVLAVWAATRWLLDGRASFVALAFIAGEVLISLRSYVAATVAVVAFAAVLLSTAPLRRRVSVTAVAALLTAIVIGQSLNAIGVGFGGEIVAALEREREAMTVGTRTAFAPTPSPAPVVGPAPSAGTQPGTDPGGDLSPSRTLNYLPTGIAFALFAPFPLFTRRAQEIAAAPEMLVWYALVVAGVATLWRERRRWRQLAPLALVIGGLMAVFALAEGNVGTLFRHRAMVMPFAAGLASPSLVLLWARRRRLRG